MTWIRYNNNAEYPKLHYASMHKHMTNDEYSKSQNTDITKKNKHLCFNELACLKAALPEHIRSRQSGEVYVWWRGEEDALVGGTQVPQPLADPLATRLVVATRGALDRRKEVAGVL